MISRFVLFGALGDLSARYLLPALAELGAAGQLPDGFQVTGSGREDLDDRGFREWAAGQLEEHADLPAAPREALLRALRYRQADVSDPAEVAAAMAGDGPAVAYLALPPAVFPAAVEALGAAELNAGSRVVLEKPFGEDTDSAVRLNRLLGERFDEDAVFRVDHFLAMSTVQNLLGVRFANRLLEPVWNGLHVAEVTIVWDETLGLEGRAGYYDRTGALEDMVQNHLLQILCLVAMEAPTSLGARDLRARKTEVLRAVRPSVEGSRRARYAGYAQEEGVDPERRTETFAEVQLTVEGWRWAGTRFRLRTGKALGQQRKEVVVRFRDVPHLPFGQAGDPRPDVLRFGLDPARLTLELTGTGPGEPFALAPLALAADLPATGLPTYARLLRDVLAGDTTLSIGAQEAEEAWRVVTPVLDAWRADGTPLQEYAPGSDGP
jgi:glucose-6-phosphate 1-dehydrogenase